MATTLYAQPYDLAATGFYFTDAESYAANAGALRNDYGQRVEEFEIQFIDGDGIDCALARAVGLFQGSVSDFFERIDDWDDHQKRAAIIAAGECGYQLGWDGDPDALDVDIYEVETLRDLAEQFIEEGLFGEIPERLQFYIDLDAVARDLGMDYAEIEIAGTRLVYRCG